eukprot:3223645-Amphidinium_carterae.2
MLGTTRICHAVMCATLDLQQLVHVELDSLLLAEIAYFGGWNIPHKRMVLVRDRPTLKRESLDATCVQSMSVSMFFNVLLIRDDPDQISSALPLLRMPLISGNFTSAMVPNQ